MQIVEAVGGTFLLQETRPVVLYGALTIITSGPDNGWVLASLYPSGSEFSCEIDAGGVCLKMGLDVAVRFASTLLVLASVHLPELNEVGNVDIGELTISGPLGHKVMSWGSAKGAANVKVTLEDGTIEVRLRSSLAMAVGFRILRQTGQLSASPDQGV